MIKNEVAVIGIGLGGQTVGYDFQQRNYHTLLVNGSKQDNQTLPDAKNVMVLEGYDGLAGDRSLAYEALRKNKYILKKVKDIEQKVILVIATGGGTTGSGCIPHICNIACMNPDKIVCAVLIMPREDESIQKRINAYNTAKELMEIPEMGAIIFVNNQCIYDLQTINKNLVNMLDFFFTDVSSSSGSNFDDSEKMKMLKDHGAFVISALADKKVLGQDVTKKISTQDIIKALTAKNIFLPINDDGIVGHIGIINQRGNHIDEKEIVSAIGTPENIFIGNNGNINIACASGLGFPVEYLSNMGKKAAMEQKERISKRKSFSILDDLDIEEAPETIVQKPVNKRRQVSLDLLRELD